MRQPKVNMNDKDIRVRAIPLDLWHRVKVVSAERDMTIRELVIKALRAYVCNPIHSVCASPVCDSPICSQCGECPNGCGFLEDESSPHMDCKEPA